MVGCDPILRSKQLLGLCDKPPVGVVNKGGTMYTGKQPTRIVGRDYLHVWGRLFTPNRAAKEIHEHVSIDGRRPTHREAKFLADRWIGWNPK